MKRPNRQLLDDLLEDSVSPEFSAALMDKTFRSARQRKRVRYFSQALGAIALVGVFAFVFLEMRKPADSLNQIRAPILSAAPAPSLSAVPVVGTEPDSSLTVVQTSEADRPTEINDKELMTLLADKSVALVRYGSSPAQLISLNQNN